MSADRMMVLALVGGCVLLLQSEASRGQNPAGGAVAVSTEDRKFILDAAQSELHEVQMGMLGIERSSNNDLKVYAQRLFDDHTLSNAEVQALARLKGVTLPDPTKTDTSAVNLSRLTGIEFDQAFVRASIEDHLKDLAEFEKEDQSSAADADIRGFAHSTLPKLRAHLEQAKALKP
jgi:putative membrane protein